MKKPRYTFPPQCIVNGNGGRLSQGTDSIDSERFFELIKKLPAGLDFKEEGARSDCYAKVLTVFKDIKNFGTVNIINVMFFLSKGAIPIYDYYAHVAIKALLMDKSPLDIYVPNAPGKEEKPQGHKEDKDHLSAINVLEEYMWLLEQVFPEEICKQGSTAYISRDLDRALWVYGHATKKYIES